MNTQPLIPLNEPNNPTFKSNTLYSSNPVLLTKNYSTTDNTQKRFQYEDNNSQNSLRLKELLSKTNTLLSKIGIEEQINNPFYTHSNNIHSTQSSSNIPIRNISIVNTLSTDTNINPLIKTIDSKETIITQTEEHKSNQPSLASFNFKDQNYLSNKTEYGYINHHIPPLDITNFNNSDIDKLTQYPLEDQVKILFKANLYLNKQIQQLHKENSELRNEISSYRFTTQSCTNSQSIIKDNDKFNNNIIEENQKLKHLNKQYEQEIQNLKLQMNSQYLHNNNNKPITTTTKQHNRRTISDNNVLTIVNPIPIQKTKKPKSRMKHHQIISELPKDQQQQHSNQNDVICNNKTVTISSTLRDDDESKDIKRKFISNNVVNLKEQNEFNKKLSRKIILENDNQHHQMCGSYYNIENTSTNTYNNNIQTHSKTKTNKHIKKSIKKKHKTSKSNINNNNNNIIYSIPTTHSKCYYDYYGNNTERTKVCYACLFGLNQNSKGYSPLMCTSRNVSPSKTLSSKRSKKHY